MKTVTVAKGDILRIEPSDQVRLVVVQSFQESRGVFGRKYDTVTLEMKEETQ